MKKMFSILVIAITSLVVSEVAQAQRDSNVGFGLCTSTYSIGEYLYGGVNIHYQQSEHFGSFFVFSGGKRLCRFSAGLEGKFIDNKVSPVIRWEVGFEFPLSIEDQEPVKNSSKGANRFFIQLAAGVQYDISERFVLGANTGFGCNIDPKGDIDDVNWRLWDTQLFVCYKIRAN